MDRSLKHTETKKIIGRVEKIDLPDLFIFEIDAKIDTGAYTSSLHCHTITVEKIKGRLIVHFYVLDPNHPEYNDRQYEAPVHKIKRVRSSNGQIEERVIIKQKIKFFETQDTIQLSLTDRSKMKYPVLIGRRFLTNKFVVDVSQKFLSK